MSEPKIQIKIDVFENGDIQVRDFPVNRIIALGIMLTALDVVRNYSPADSARVEIVTPQVIVP